MRLKDPEGKDQRTGKVKTSGKNSKKLWYPLRSRCRLLIDKSHHRIFLFVGCEVELVSFISGIHDHQGCIRWNGAQVFTHHNQFLFLSLQVYFDRNGNGSGGKPPVRHNRHPVCINGNSITIDLAVVVEVNMDCTRIHFYFLYQLRFSFGKGRG